VRVKRVDFEMQFLNVIINNGNVFDSDRTNLFPDNETVHVFDTSKDMFDLLVILGAFVSKSAARKNWKITNQKIPFGWTHIQGIGKHRREIAIWNPEI
jgi:hypothetical protein